MKTNQKIEAKIQQLKNDEIDVGHGEGIVISAYIRTQKTKGSDVLVLHKNLWPQEYGEVVEALKENEINEFILKDTSTGLMGTLQYLVENGATIADTKTFTEDKFFNDEPEKGLLIKL